MEIKCVLGIIVMVFNDTFNNISKTGDVLKDVKVICNFLRQYKKGDPLI
jgi:hypothetical protein